MGTNYDVTFPDREPVHLGKQSAGWTFLFRADPAWPQEEALARWHDLATSGEIRDEYGHPVTMEWLLESIAYAQQREGAQRDHHGSFIDPSGYEFIASEFC